LRLGLQAFPALWRYDGHGHGHGNGHGHGHGHGGHGRGHGPLHEAQLGRMRCLEALQEVRLRMRILLNTRMADGTRGDQAMKSSVIGCLETESAGKGCGGGRMCMQ
jgi:hypothetical protein